MLVGGTVALMRERRSWRCAFSDRTFRIFVKYGVCLDDVDIERFGKLASRSATCRITARGRTPIPRSP